MPASSQQIEVSPFFLLPAEIRNQVYNYLLTFSEPICINCTPGTTAIAKDPSSREQQLSALLVNKQFRREALPIICRNNTFRLPTTTALTSFLENLGPSNRALVRRIEVSLWDGPQGHKEDASSPFSPLPSSSRPPSLPASAPASSPSQSVPALALSHPQSPTPAPISAASLCHARSPHPSPAPAPTPTPASSFPLHSAPFLCSSPSPFSHQLSPPAPSQPLTHISSEPSPPHPSSISQHKHSLSPSTTPSFSLTTSLLTLHHLETLHLSIFARTNPRPSPSEIHSALRALFLALYERHGRNWDRVFEIVIFDGVKRNLRKECGVHGHVGCAGLGLCEERRRWVGELRRLVEGTCGRGE